MEILNENYLQEIKRIVYNKARYQKVMLLYDDTVSNSQIMDIYEEVKVEYKNFKTGITVEKASEELVEAVSE